MRILLTGATGFLGNNLLRLLLEGGHDVVCTCRQGSDSRPFDGLNVDKLDVDFAELSSAGSILDRIEFVIHSAAFIHIGWECLQRSRQINVEATKVLAQAARLKEIPMILVSTVDVLGVAESDQPVDESKSELSNPACSYVVSKREAEVVFRQQLEQGLSGLIVNPGFVVGPWDWKPSSGKMLLEVGKNFTPLAPSGGCSVVDVRDVACGIVSAMQHGEPGANYILAGHNVSYLDLWTKMCEIAGSRPPRGTLPDWLNAVAGRVGDLQCWLTGKEPTVNSAATQMGALNHWYSSQKAVKELGYKMGPFEDAISDAWSWFEKYEYL